MGVIDELGPGLEDVYTIGQRVIVGAITPCGQCFYCWNGSHSQCGGPLGGWKFGNTTVGARLKGASIIIGVDPNPDRLAIARRFGATVTLRRHRSARTPGDL